MILCRFLVRLQGKTVSGDKSALSTLQECRYERQDHIRVSAKDAGMYAKQLKERYAGNAGEHTGISCVSSAVATGQLVVNPGTYGDLPC